MLLIHQFNTLCPAAPLLELCPSWSIPILVINDRACSVLLTAARKCCCSHDLMLDHVLPNSAGMCNVAPVAFTQSFHLTLTFGGRTKS